MVNLFIFFYLCKTQNRRANIENIGKYKEALLFYVIPARVRKSKKM